MKKKIKFVAGLLSFLIAACQPLSAFSAVAESGQEALEEKEWTTPDELEPDLEDPDYVKRMLQSEQEEERGASFSLRAVTATNGTTKSPFTGLTYTNPSQVDASDIVQGIDVSKWQADIDWAKVKAAGVEYVFIRCGYTSISSGLTYQDTYFKKNIEAASAQGVQIGVYYFANSKTTAEAEAEAKKTLEILSPYKDLITLPVVFDFEAFNASYRAYGLPQAQISQNAKTYFDLIEDVGYDCMYYGSTSILPQYFTEEIRTSYDCWVAQYNTKTTCTEDISFWQYTDVGKVNGITGAVDCDFWFRTDRQEDDKKTTNTEEPKKDPVVTVEPPAKVTGVKMQSSTNNSITVQWNKVDDADGYILYRSKVYGGTYSKLKTVTGADTCSFQDQTVEKSQGLQYYYKVAAYKKVSGQTYTGNNSSILTAYTTQDYKFKLKTLDDINLRKKAGTEYQVLAEVPKGTILKYKKYTLSKAGGYWYKVTYKVDGESYAGYLSGNYVSLRTYGKATANVNLRQAAETKAAIKMVVPKDQSMTVLKSLKDAVGNNWSYVQFKNDGKTVKGYMVSKYIRQI